MKGTLTRILLPCVVISTLFVNSAFLAGRTQAGPLVFSVDPAQSQLTLSGKIAGYAFTTQGSGSLATTYGGNINATVSGSTIQFPGSSTVTARTNGVWQPAVGGGSGSAAADYGGQSALPIAGTAYAALRNIVLDLTSSALTISGTNFNSGALIFFAAAGSGAELDYHSPVKSSSLGLAGYATNTIADQASLSTNGPVVTLAIQINTTFSFTLLSANDTPITLTGRMVATNSAGSSAPPFIDSLTISNQSLVLSVANATVLSQLQVSTNLTTWSAASTTVSNNAGITVFTTTGNGPRAYFRVEK